MHNDCHEKKSDEQYFKKVFFIIIRPSNNYVRLDTNEICFEYFGEKISSLSRKMFLYGFDKKNL